jgi:hypothetical protein
MQATLEKSSAPASGFVVTDEIPMASLESTVGIEHVVVHRMFKSLADELSLWMQVGKPVTVKLDKAHDLTTDKMKYVLSVRPSLEGQ